MTKRLLITKSLTKRITAAAIAEAKARNGWSNADAGDALDCSEGTVRERLDADEAGKQMTVHELRRVTQADGAAIANRILADLGYRLVPIAGGAAAPDAMALAVQQARCNADLLEAAPDGIDLGEARRLLPQYVALADTITHFKAQLRAIIEGHPPSQ